MRRPSISYLLFYLHFLCLLPPPQAHESGWKPQLEGKGLLSPPWGRAGVPWAKPQGRGKQGPTWQSKGIVQEAVAGAKAPRMPDSPEPRGSSGR